jgi:hypothetical protein
MRRLLAGIAVIAVVGVVVAVRGSNAASAGRGVRAVSAVTVTPRLKRLLGGEIAKLRALQPSAPSAPRVPSAPRALPRTPRRFLAPDSGVSCFVLAGSRCPEIPCQEFASAPAVFHPGATEMIRPGARRGVAAPACVRRRPRKLVLVSGP